MSTTPLTQDIGQVYRLEGHTDIVTSVAWSLSGDRLTSASGDTTTVVWDPMSGARVAEFEERAEEGVVSVRTSDGSLLASSSGVMWSPDSGRLASCGEDKIVTKCDAGSHAGAMVSTGRAVATTVLKTSAVEERADAHTSQALGDGDGAVAASMGTIEGGVITASASMEGPLPAIEIILDSAREETTDTLSGTVGAGQRSATVLAAAGALAASAEAQRDRLSALLTLLKKI